MHTMRQQTEQTALPAIQTPSRKELSRFPDSLTGAHELPKVVITGDIRLQVTKSAAAPGLVKGRYRIETDDIQEPFHVIWMCEGQVIKNTAHSIEVAFDVKDMLVGETLTQLLTAQVTERNGQRRIIHSSIFVQISVVQDAQPVERFSVCA